MKEKTKIIYLRGHHLLCLQGYQGYGYDEKFKSNMEKILNNLKDDNQNKKIIVTDSPDYICEFCPNLKEDICCGELDISDKTAKNQEKIAEINTNICKKDSIILKKSNLIKNKKYSFSELISIINTTFQNIKEAKEICEECKWIDKCLWYQSRI
jgi:hypothetical protein